MATHTIYDALLLDAAVSLVLDNSTLNTVAGEEMTLTEPVTADGGATTLDIGDTFNASTITDLFALSGDIY